MKTISKLLLTFLWVLPIFAFTQEHLKFKNVPINGTVTEFAKQMQSLGFTLVETKNNIVIMQGDFINKSCKLYVVGSKKTNIVWKVYITLPEETSWSSIKSNYFEIRDQFKKKYGEGKSYEFFSKPYYEGDGYELQALRNDKCSYSTFWEMENGAITVEMSSTERIAISYEDSQNVKIQNSEKAEIINNDI